MLTCIALYGEISFTASYHLLLERIVPCGTPHLYFLYCNNMHIFNITTLYAFQYEGIHTFYGRAFAIFYWPVPLNGYEYRRYNQ